MKCKEKILVTRFLLVVFFFITMQAARSNDLYLYLSDGSKQTYLVSDIRKLTFSESSMMVTTISNVEENVPYANLKFFSLKDLDTGLSSPVTISLNVSPTMVTDKVTLACEANISNVVLYDLSGKELLQLGPESQRVDIFMDSYSSGVYLLHVSTELGVVVKKIIKK